MKKQMFYMKGAINGKELLKKLSHETRKALDTIPEEEWLRGYKVIKKAEKRRLNLLVQALSSKKHIK